MPAETPTGISLRHFLDAGYALLLEDALRVPACLGAGDRDGGQRLQECHGETVTESTAPVRHPECQGDGTTRGDDGAGEEVSEFLAEAQVLIRPERRRSSDRSFRHRSMPRPRVSPPPFPCRSQRRSRCRRRRLRCSDGCTTGCNHQHYGPRHGHPNNEYVLGKAGDVLEAVTGETLAKAGADRVLKASTDAATTYSQDQAALLGLRTAVGARR